MAGLLVFGLGLGEVRAATDLQGRSDLAFGVHAVFTAKCAQCHGANLRKPKGRFGYVLDLKRLAANPDLVVPSNPDASKLWKLVSRDKMPPPGRSRAGPLTAADKETIRAWIEAGAPSTPGTSAATIPAEEGTTQAAELPFGGRILFWLGKFHVSVVHFPIGLLLAAAVGELWFLWRRIPVPSPAVRFCVLLGAAAAVPAAALGWLHAGYGGYGASEPDVLHLHRWLGTAAACWAVGVALLSEADARSGKRRWRFRIALLFGALLTGLTGHLGGILVHGQDFFDW